MAAPPPDLRLVLGGLLLGNMLGSVDQFIVAAALPEISGELGGVDELPWIVTAYLLASTVSMPLYGRLGDALGRKRLYQFAVLVFLAGSALCGIAGSVPQLALFRAVQGLGGGGLIVLGHAIVGEAVSPRERGRYQGYLAAGFGFASIAAPLLGGLITDHLHWRWIFYVNLPLGLVTLLVVSAALPARRGRSVAQFDHLGVAALALAATGVAMVTSWGGVRYAWRSPLILGLGAATLVAAVVLVVAERRAVDPVVPYQMFADRSFSIASSVSFVMGVTKFVCLSFLPLFLQVVSGASPTDSGFLLLPMMFGIVVAAVGTGQVVSRTGRHYKLAMFVGVGLAGLGTLLFGTMGPSTPSTAIAGYMTLVGCGIGLASPMVTLVAQNSVPPGLIGSATSSVRFLQAMGGCLGVAVFGAVLNGGLRQRLPGLGVTFEDGSSFDRESIVEAGAPAIEAFSDVATQVFLLAAPVVLVGLVAVLWLQERPLRAMAGPDLVVDPDTGSTVVYETR